MKNEVYLQGVIKRLDVYDRSWRAWVTVPKVGIEGTTSVPVVGYDVLDDAIGTNSRVEIVGHLAWRRYTDDDNEWYELVIVADSTSIIKPQQQQQRKGVTNGHNTNARRVR